MLAMLSDEQGNLEALPEETVQADIAETDADVVGALVRDATAMSLPGDTEEVLITVDKLPEGDTLDTVVEAGLEDLEGRDTVQLRVLGE